MSNHWHLAIDHILIYGMSAILTIHIMRFIAAQMVTREGAIKQAGEALAGIVSFGE